MYNNSCYEDISALNRELETLIDNCDKIDLPNRAGEACLVERLRIANGLVKSVAEAIKENI